jgi:transposase
MANRKFTQEFKDSTVQLVLNSEASVLKIGADLDVNPKTIYNWIREYKQLNNIPTDSRRKVQSPSIKESSDDELKRLRSENKLLKQERDILKKATAYFAKETL